MKVLLFMQEINLYFWKLAVIRYPEEFKSNFCYYKDGQDTVVHLGRYEFYIIPRTSVSYHL